MKYEKYNKKKNKIIIVQLATAAAVTLTIYFLTLNKYATAAALLGYFILIFLTTVLNKLDDKFITNIISDLSVLVDTLAELEETHVFQENCDTITSKLQSKVINLSRILKKKNIDSLQEKENIKGLVSDISHQLKTPIANLKMYSEFLSDDTITAQQRKEYINVIILSIDRLNFLSESMIKISRLESGLINIAPVPQGLNETILKAIKDVFHKANQKNIEITFSSSEKENITVLHDKNWTAEAIFNLLDNAVKYSESDKVICISIRKLGIFTAVEISDQNEKIPESEYAKIFQRFYRGTNSKKNEGIGVGLYLAQEILEKQGGYINLRANENGNTFSLFLPVYTHKENKTK